ncbi:titin isoform X3 [Scophthalmus maximus]|uniref:titin isoform X3 n=1 Tax=Scophthalmus maximus TaxID=52904 RepID=UPI0015E09AEB|nr:titin isoform X3 [Scophthalmus maximus]
MEASNNEMGKKTEDKAHTLNIKLTPDTNTEITAVASQSPSTPIVQGPSDTENREHNPRVPPGPIADKENAIKPTLQISLSTFTVKSGEDLKVEIPVAGKPAPKIEWNINGNAVKETSRLEVSATPSLTVLHIRHATREHSCQYSVTASNSAGKFTGEITVVVLEKPDPPTGPVRIDEVSSDYATISWEPPEYTGGCQLDNYIVEKRETTSTEWQTVSATTVRTTIKVTKLKTGNEYQFRVFAENSNKIQHGC